jgi:murein DD-endopeptidase MepM/ murein hydrolase activator NlpD
MFDKSTTFFSRRWVGDLFAGIQMVRFARTLLVLLVVAVAVGVFRQHLEDAGIWDKLALPYRVARLYTEPADPSILMPVKGVSPRSVANTWHAPRSGGRKHEGQDIFARRGTPVLAAADGIVVKFGGGALGGNAVFVAGRGGRTFYYAHLDRYAEVEIGQIVNRGDVLGYVGNTGNARTTPPHLHFGVYSAKGPLNPLPLIEGRSSESLSD